MAYCDICIFYDKQYDEFQQNYDDVITEGENQVLHHCPMYIDHIPNRIFYHNAECEFYDKDE